MMKLTLADFENSRCLNQASDLKSFHSRSFTFFQDLLRTFTMIQDTFF